MLRGMRRFMTAMTTALTMSVRSVNRSPSVYPTYDGDCPLWLHANGQYVKI